MLKSYFMMKFNLQKRPMDPGHSVFVSKGPFIITKMVLVFKLPVCVEFTWWHKTENLVLNAKNNNEPYIPTTKVAD